MNKVTAIVSAYYAKEYIDGRLRNLLEQTLVPDIFVVAERGSYEAKRAKHYKINNIILTEGIPNINVAWNMAIKEVSGDYIVPANCDDTFLEDGLDRLSRALDEHPDYALSYSEVLLKTSAAPPKVWNRGGGQGVRALMSSMFVGPFPMWRASLHHTYGLFEENLINAGDYEWFMRLAANNEKFYHIDKPAGIYLRRADSLEHRNSAIIKEETKLIKERYSKYL